MDSCRDNVLSKITIVSAFVVYVKPLSQRPVVERTSKKKTRKLSSTSPKPVSLLERFFFAVVVALSGLYHALAIKGDGHSNIQSL